MQIFKSSRKQKILNLLGQTLILVAIFSVHLSDGRILSMKNIEGNANIERVDTTLFKESRKLLVNKDLLLLCVFFFFSFSILNTRAKIEAENLIKQVLHNFFLPLD